MDVRACGETSWLRHYVTTTGTGVTLYFNFPICIVNQVKTLGVGGTATIPKRGKKKKKQLENVLKNGELQIFFACGAYRHRHTVGEGRSSGVAVASSGEQWRSSSVAVA